MTNDRALPAPTGDVVLIDEPLLEQALAAARQSPRGRIILPFHRGPQETVHRMLNAMQPGTYVRPHRHQAPPKHESFIVLRGAVAFFVFADDGRIQAMHGLGAGYPTLGIDVQPGLYHSLVVLAPDTLIYEIKSGPYSADTDKSFAPFSPGEGSPEAARYTSRLLAAFAGGPT
jgi:cupin fold WbuC family metalloprotein